MRTEAVDAKFLREARLERLFLRLPPVCPIFLLQVVLSNLAAMPPDKVKAWDAFVEILVNTLEVTPLGAESALASQVLLITEY